MVQPLQDTYVLTLISFVSIYMLNKHLQTNWAPKTENLINSGLIYGFIILFHSTFGVQAITEQPKVLENLVKTPFMKFFSLAVITFGAVRDFEDTLFVLLAFMAILQIMRSKEERKKYPYILV